MLIVCTKDQNIRNHAQDPGSGANNWGQVRLLRYDGAPDVPPLNDQWITSLQQLVAAEALCLSAHGNDTEIGDAGEDEDEDPDPWSWNLTDIASFLAGAPPPAWLGPVLISACASDVVNFSAGLAVTLQDMQARNSMWCYGYNRAIDANTTYPDPGNLAIQVDLQGTQVTY